MLGVAALGAVILLVLDPFGGPPRWAYDTMTYVKLGEALSCFPGCNLGYDYAPAAMVDAHFQTTFPLGYPLILHALRGLGLSMLAAPFVASALAYVGTVVATADLALNYLAGPLALVAALLVGMASPVLEMGRDSGSEMTSVFLFVLGLALLARARRTGDERSRLLLLIAASLATAATMWIRYAMAPAVAAFGLALVMTWRRPRELTGALTALASGVASLMILNVSLGHSITGPFRPPSDSTLFGNGFRLLNHVVNTTFGVLGNKEHDATVALAAILSLVLGWWAWDALGRARRAGWLHNTEYLAALSFLPFYGAFLVITATRVQYDPLEDRFMAVFAAALVLVLVMPTLAALQLRQVPTPVRAALAGTVLLFFFGQHRGGVSTPWPVWRHLPHPFEVVSPEVSAAVDAAIDAAPPALIASNHKGLLLRKHGLIYLGTDLHFRPSLLTEGEVDELTCTRDLPLLLVLDRSRWWLPDQAGDYLRRLMKGKRSARLTPLLVRDEVLVFLAPPRDCQN